VSELKDEAWSIPEISNINKSVDELHWLPISELIRYKIANLCYRAVRFEQPFYLAELVHDYRPVRLLRFADGHTLTVPRSRTVIAGRRFSCFVPPICNSLLFMFALLHHLTVSDNNSRLTFSVSLLMLIHNYTLNHFCEYCAP